MAKDEQGAPKESRVQLKKKSWHKIVAPAVFSQKEIGESYLQTAEEAIGRTIGFNLKELTGNVKDQNASIKFRIQGVEKGMLQTAVVGYQLSPSSVRRAVKKGTNRLDHYTVGFTQDKQPVVIKSLFITIRKVKHSVQAEVRKQASAFFREELRKGDFSTFVANVVAQKIQQQLRKRLQKVYPLREIAIRMIVLRKASKKEQAQVEEAVPEAAAESEEEAAQPEEEVSEEETDQDEAAEETPSV